MSTGKRLAVLGALAAAGAAVWAVGNYFVNFSLMRSHKNSERDAKKAQGHWEELGAGNEAVKAGRAASLRAEEAFFTAHPAQKLTLTTPDNILLAADYVPAPDSHRWVMLIHGYKGQNKEMRGYALHWHQWGCHVLMPDLRGHGESGGNTVGMGWADRPDLLLWLQEILRRDPRAAIVLHGHSMGGAAVLMLSGEKSLPENVRAVVSDCAYTDVWEMFALTLKSWFRLPAFPVLHIASAVFRLRGGYSLRAASALKAVARDKTPTLFIHGDMDEFIPPEMARRLYDACPAPKKLLYVKGAGHAQSQYADPELYFATVKSFVEPYLQ